MHPLDKKYINLHIYLLGFAFAYSWLFRPVAPPSSDNGEEEEEEEEEEDELEGDDCEFEGDDDVYVLLYSLFNLLLIVH